MKKELSPLQIALSKIPGWEKIEVLFENMPTDAELAKLEVEFAASVTHDLEYDFGFDSVGPPPSDSVVADRPLPAGELQKTTKVSIRIPTDLVMAFKEKSKEAKVGYQTLMNRVLKSAAESEARKS